ncbi:hypothetical protein TOPH_06175 [Tolypocladium ophioglossoides CBS 100239]|uniref:Uncharacterized protein n=1 Tax=Tolypocladium ophioglossoides (strain CBS 100239) TaxID=1163406 RepID=A0A0L0N5F3_TOLOC|nr:hypothetical protein TOPH_06175 [Tolypocladium ophioglossoides CBS 100239]
MFIYTGKLEWLHYGEDELFVVVLPNGPVRVGDTVYFYFRWTINAKGVKNPKWFQSLNVEEIVKTENGDDTFQLSHGYYSWEIQSQKGYQTITVNMSNPDGHKSAMSLDRTYQPKGEASTDAARIWTGKLDWPRYATNELFIVIVPDGFGADKPVLAFWQWTVNAENKPKSPCLVHGVQQAETPSEGVFKFTFTDYYIMACTWDEKTERLAINMQEPQKHGQDIGPFNLAALVERNVDGLTPPELPVGKAESEVRYPQAEPALARIHTPMPFPRTLVETLTHTAAFLDEAGHLAKYAVDRYHTLDKSYHALLTQNDDLNRQIGQLTVVGGKEKKEIDSLQEQLAVSLDAAAKKEAELTQKVQDLQKASTKEMDHDSEDHSALKAAHEQIQKEQDARSEVEKQVVTLQFALSEGQTRISQLQVQDLQLVSEISNLRGQLDTEKAHNAELGGRAGDLEAKVAMLENDAAAMQKTLARTTEDLKQAQEDAKAKDKVICGLKNDVAAKEKAYEERQKITGAIIQTLEDQMAKLEAKWPFPDGSSFPNPFPDGSIPNPFPDGSIPNPSTDGSFPLHTFPQPPQQTTNDPTDATRKD